MCLGKGEGWARPQAASTSGPVGPPGLLKGCDHGSGPGLLRRGAGLLHLLPRRAGPDPGPWQLGLGKGPAVRPVEVIRFLAFEEKPNCLKDAWFVFDLALVLMMILVRASEGSQKPANRSKSWGPRQR